MQFGIMLGKDLRRQKGGVSGAGFTDRQRANRDAARHPGWHAGDR